MVATLGKAPLPLPLGYSFLPDRKSLSSLENEHNVGEVLVWRKDELSSLKREKKCVSSLLSMCEKVKQLVQGDPQS